jgi:hypothetical protein
MALVNRFRCEVCGSITGRPFLWLVIQPREACLTIRPWDVDAAIAPDAAHVCGETDAQIYVSRWMDSVFLKNKCLPVRDAEPLQAKLADRLHRHSDQETVQCFHSCADSGSAGRYSVPSRD